MATVQVKNGRRLSENDLWRLAANYGSLESITRGVGTWSLYFRNPQIAQRFAQDYNGYDIGVGKLRTSIVTGHSNLQELSPFYRNFQYY